MDQKNEVERKKAWQAPKLEALPVEETLTGTVPGLPEDEQAGDSHRFGGRFS